MAFSRANYTLGPCRVVRGAGTVFTKAGANVRILPVLTPVFIDGYGEVDQRMTDAMVKLTATPEGRWNAATRAFLWPYLNPTLPVKIFGSTDTPTVLHGSDSHLHTIYASAVTKMPSLKLSRKEVAIGDVEITGIRALAKGWADPLSLYTAATSGGTFTDSALVLSDIKVQPYSGVWGSKSGYTSIQTEEGWTVDFETDINFREIEEVGTVDAFLRSVKVMAKCTPLAVSWADIEAAILVQNTGGAMGRSLAAGGADLVITGLDGSTIVTIKNANMVEAGYRFGSDVLRDGEVGFVGTRTFASGVAAALATLA
jgi:hypothetical protein